LNVTEALNANVELIGAFKKKFPTTKKVIAWGNSLGTMHSQKLVETNPDLVDGLVLACPAANPSDALVITLAMHFMVSRLTSIQASRLVAIQQILLSAKQNSLPISARF